MLKPVNVRNIKKRIDWINSVIDGDSRFNYMVGKQLEDLIFERRCLLKLLELIIYLPNDISAKRQDNG